jgi:hypothetical protein
MFFPLPLPGIPRSGGGGGGYRGLTEVGADSERDTGLYINCHTLMLRQVLARDWKDRKDLERLGNERNLVLRKSSEV